MKAEIQNCINELMELWTDPNYIPDSFTFQPLIDEIEKTESQLKEERNKVIFFAEYVVECIIRDPENRKPNGAQIREMYKIWNYRITQTNQDETD